MPNSYYKSILFALGIMFFSFSYAQQKAVYLGSDQFKKQPVNENPYKQNKDLISEIQSMDDANTEIFWLPNTDKERVLEQLVNVGEFDSTVNICRAAFLGANLQGQGLYPGQLIKEGCRISYGGYAFIVTKYEVLSGNSDNNLKWVPINDIMKQIQTQNTNKNSNQIQSIKKLQEVIQANSATYYSGMNSSMQETIDNIVINKARPISGGEEGGYPVLICLAKHNDLPTIGKLVFSGSDFACDIGVDDKEVIISNGYKLLFWKSR